MKVIILKTGEVKEVSPGYARNFLFPQKLAVIATDNALKQAEEKRKKIAAVEAEEKKIEQETIQKIKDIVVKITVKTNEEGKMFAALNIKDVKDALLKQYQIDIKEEWIKMPVEPIKELGEYILEIVTKFGFKNKLKIKIYKQGK
jgi:large subunit ribosomal protein L9